MPSSSKKSAGTAGNILLVEDYQALAIAFGTALKKFAGNYKTHVVGSLTEAEGLLEVLRPQLIVLDFDPPPRGSLAFFKQIKATLPDTRALIVAATKTPDFSADRFTPAALHFIEKPFELAKFGAAINRLLFPETESETFSEGTLRDLSLTDMIILYAVSGGTMALQVEAGGGRSGEIHFSDGRISHAAVMGQSGMVALQTILHWRSARFSEAERLVAIHPSIHGSWATVLAEALRAVRLSPAIVLEGPIQPAAVPAALGRKIMVVDDTELLSIFVEEVLVTADPTFEVATAFSGLEGLERIVTLKPDLVLLDYSLPDITGAEISRRLLENAETAAIPIIMMSGHVPEMAETAARFENVVATIAKPFLSSALVELVQRTFAELPQLSARRSKRAAANSAPPLVEAMPPTAEHKKSKNGNRTAQPDFAPPPLPEEEPEFTVAPPPPEEEEPTLAVAFNGPEPEALPIPSVAAPEEKIAPPPSRSAPAISRPSGVPAVVKAAQLNAIVLGLPLEVISLEFSPSLRIRKIRARPFSSLVSLHVLPQGLASAPFTDAMFELGRVDLDQDAQINLVLLAPTNIPPAKPQGYPSAIDGVIISPADYGEAVQLTPTAVAPMRMQHLALFELSTVELSADFRVAHLVLKSRGGKTRVTLFPGVAQKGATFDTAEVRVSQSGQIEEILLQAAES